MLRFMGNMISAKASQAVQSGIEALVRWDPQTASEAELKSMEQHLDDLGRQVAAARHSYDKEKREADAIQLLSSQRFAAADLLQRQIDTEIDPERKAGLEKSLNTLVTLLEQMSPEVNREKAEADDAKDFLEMLEQTYAEAGGKLKEGRAQLDRARRDMTRAEQQRQTAEQQAEAARRAAGLSSAASSLSVALKAMQDSAAKDLANADVALAKAKLLRPTAPEQDDPNIARAMDAAAGKSPAPQSLTDRLAALKAARV